MRHGAIPAVAAAVLTFACRAQPAEVSPQAAEPASEPAADSADVPVHAGTSALFEPGKPEYPPRSAYLAGLLPLNSIGVPEFLARHPRYDGRGVVIGILDTGLDPDLPGFRMTSTGSPKIIDLRDFSGEGRVHLAEVVPQGDIIRVGEAGVDGAARLMSRVTGPTFAGLFTERQLGVLPAADVNGDGDNLDEFLVAVGRATDGWLLITDTDGDGTLADETPVRDYAIAAQTFTYHVDGIEQGPLTIAANLTGDSVPTLDLFFDNQGHGSHVAGIAAGHDMFGVPGFNGVAPGAQIMGLKISNNARGAVTVTGSVLRAMNYAADYAERRGLPLVLNLSFGVGNVREGEAAIDSIVNQFALKHPDILFVSSSGNDGPGLSTISVPATADLALSVCALYPAAFTQAAAFNPDPQDVLAWWSARGGETDKPDLCAPGLAFSNVPRWQAGEEISPGTSMASPQLAGAAALLLSAMRSEGLHVRAADLKAALKASATPVPNVSVLDQGRGVPSVGNAYWWLRAGHQGGAYVVRTVEGGQVTPHSAAYRRNGLLGAETEQKFQVASLLGQPAARILLRSDAPWIVAPDEFTFDGRPAEVSVAYRFELLAEPGVYVGTVWGQSATDTLAGDLFGLRSTIVVPYALDSVLGFEGQTMLGSFDRYFVDLSHARYGASVVLELSDWSRSASVHIYEPSGHPYSGGSILEASDGKTVVQLDIPANDLIAGVYELVVTTGDALPVEYYLGVESSELPLEIASDSSGLVIENATRDTIRTRVEALVLGTREVGSMWGGSQTENPFNVDVPEWASKIEIALSVDEDFWGTLSDLGIALIGADDRILYSESLNYPVQRILVPAKKIGPGPARIELTPGFAHLESHTPWTAEVAVSMFMEMPLPVGLNGAGESGKVTIAPFTTSRLALEAAGTAARPTGAVLAEFRVAPFDGPLSVARGVVVLPEGVDTLEVTRP